MSVLTRDAAQNRANLIDDLRHTLELDLTTGDATFVSLFLLSSLTQKLRPNLLALTPFTRVVSLVFRIGEWAHEWSAKSGWSDLFLLVVPA